MQHSAMPFFVAAQMANPHSALRTPLTAEAVRAKVTPLLETLVTVALLQNMISELARYQVACQAAVWDDKSFAEKADLIEIFWTEHKRLSAWTEFAPCMLIDPSSACVERAFSILKYIFGDQQAPRYTTKLKPPSNCASTVHNDEATHLVSINLTLRFVFETVNITNELARKNCQMSAKIGVFIAKTAKRECFDSCQKGLKTRPAAHLPIRA